MPMLRVAVHRQMPSLSLEATQYHVKILKNCNLTGIITRHLSSENTCELNECTLKIKISLVDWQYVAMYAKVRHNFDPKNPCHDLGHSVQKLYNVAVHRGRLF
mmetsp:Transcript_4227/g.15961  ORF Transcript_4227/g.15961 Transcript_4227/m.15961 type:complete len:103 (-) Transcript_4227:692-1000(-)